MMVRLLDSHEYALVEPIFLAQGSSLPAPELSWIAIVEDDDTGEVLAMFALHPILNAELWVHPDHAREGLAKLVVERINQLHIDYYAHTSNPRVEELCAANGMQPVLGKLYHKIHGPLFQSELNVDELLSTELPAMPTFDGKVTS